jgi:hypothetical protein
MNEAAVLECLRMLKEMHADYLACMKEMVGMMGEMGELEEEEDDTEGLLEEEDGEDFPKMDSYDGEDIDPSNPAFASGVSLGIPSSVTINKKED